ncbi:RNA polymerase sigma-70 factor, ECF subfamily [Fodinibius roseus]|uniref:RNA polymerase sigma-70 factor, ECF subfamily n=1 Tax=Fodinibius roseus TaxID=1194090 RepID=A0A1M5HJ22_9BACT|nr:RNA polymerase sigma-70 factor [Fodinibius roseus]SHG15973.1 RNA polymerase sigma-70 factor, ECF subfamily [Fodinibius roseus]
MDKPSTKQIRMWGEKITASDRKAFNSLFRSLYPRLIHFASKYNRNKAVARDIVQDAFIALWEKRKQLDPDRSIQAYLYRIVRNKSLNHIRNHSNETVGLLEDIPLEAADEDRRKQQNEKEQLVNLLKIWIEKLPKRQREAFELSRFEGLDHDEIAEVMDVSSSTVNNHIVAALKKLRDRCDEYKTKQVNDKKL